MWRYVAEERCCNVKEYPAFGKGVTLCTIVSVFFAELFGTGILLHFGCMCVLIGSTPLTIALAFGFAFATAIQCISAVSGGHVNPAVSLAAVILGIITVPMFFVYLVAQFMGGILGYGLLTLLTPDAMSASRTCCTVPGEHLSVLQAFCCELLATSVLIFLFCGCCDPRNSKTQDSTPIKFGFTISLLVAAVGPYTGASMNTVRSFSPALIHNQWTAHWIYWLAPLFASLLVPVIYRFSFEYSDFASPKAMRRLAHEDMQEVGVQGRYEGTVPINNTV